MKKILSILLIGAVVIGIFTSALGVSTSVTSADDTSKTTSTSVVEQEDNADEATEAVTDTSGESVASNATSEYLEAVEKATSKDYPDESASIDTIISFENNAAKINGDGVETSSEGITITEGGTYSLSGAFDGQIKVDAGDDDVQLILAGLVLNNSSASPIVVEQADETTITLKSGTVNTIYDGSAYVEEDTEDKTNAAIYSKDDLAINGSGTLQIDAPNKSGIISKDDLVILSGNIVVSAEHNGIKGKDLLYVGGGSLEIEAGTDGLESEIVVYIEDGNVLVTDSYEGIEALDIVIEGGVIEVHASDDGVNVSGEVETTETTETETQTGFRGPGGPGGSENLEGHGLTINGGELTIYSDGDGLDSNGSVWMNGGTVNVYGPTMNGNGSIDYNGTFVMDGGTLVAVGSIGMVQTPGSDSAVNTLSIGLSTTYDAGTSVQIIDESGNVILDYVSEKTFQSIVFSSEEIELGGSYTVTVNGETVETATVADTVTSVGTSGSMGGGHGQGGFGDRPQGERGERPERNGAFPEGEQPPEGGEPPMEMPTQVDSETESE